MYDNLRSRHSACQQAAAALAMLSK
jgi:hypothetical protein